MTAARPTRSRWTAALADPATLLMISASLIAVALLLYYEQRITFRLDEWVFLIDRPVINSDTVFLPHNEHIVVVPFLIYRALIAVFGTDSAQPFQVAAQLMFVASLGAVFVYARQRVGGWLALAGCVPILFCGAATEDTLWPFQIAFFTSMAAGVGMVLLLERDTRRADIVACGLLVIAMASSSLGIAFAVAGAVAVLLGSRPARRAFVVAVPVALYAVWYARWGHYAENALSFDNFLESPKYVFDGFASSISSLLGLRAFDDSQPETMLNVGRVLLVAGIVGAALRIRAVGVRRAFWVVLAAALAFWFLAGLNANADRAPTSGRYQYIGAIFVVMIAAELLHGVRPRRPALIAAMAGLAAVLACNIVLLNRNATDLRAGGDLVRADLAAIEIARGVVSPDFIPVPEFAGTGDVYIPAGKYFALVDSSGSPAFDEAELVAAPEPARAAADRVLSVAERIGFAKPTPVDSRGPCRTVDGTPVSLSPGKVVVTAVGGGQVRVALQRFARASFPVGVGTVEIGHPVAIGIPPDHSEVPWQLAASGPVRVCL